MTRDGQQTDRGMDGKGPPRPSHTPGLRLSVGTEEPAKPLWPGLLYGEAPGPRCGGLLLLSWPRGQTGVSPEASWVPWKLVDAVRSWAGTGTACLGAGAGHVFCSSLPGGRATAPASMCSPSELLAYHELSAEWPFLWSTHMTAWLHAWPGTPVSMVGSQHTVSCCLRASLFSDGQRCSRGMVGVSGFHLSDSSDLWAQTLLTLRCCLSLAHTVLHACVRPMCVCVCTTAHTCYVCKCICAHTCTCLHTRNCVSMCVRVHVYAWCAHGVRMCASMHMGLCARIHVCMCECARVCM